MKIHKTPLGSFVLKSFTDVLIKMYVCTLIYIYVKIFKPDADGLF